MAVGPAGDAAPRKDRGAPGRDVAEVGALVHEARRVAGRANARLDRVALPRLAG